MTTKNIQRSFALEVVNTLRQAGYEALWAGGCVRDELLGRTPKDYDVATSARPEEVQELFGKRRTLAIGASFGVIAVLGGKEREPIEVATFRADGAYLDGRHPQEVTFTSAEEDAKRRDFTINGLFYDPTSESLIDYVEGEADLQSGVIRAIGDPLARFTEDKLRMLRAVRFATTFDFVIDKSTLEAIRTMAHEISVVSAERIGVEIRKILLHPSRARGISLLNELGLFRPSFAFSSSSETSAAQFEKTLELLSKLEAPSLPLALAALLLQTPESRHGSQVCRDLRYTKKEGERVDWLLINAERVRDAHVSNWPAVQRLLIHPGAEELIALHEARIGTEDEGAAFCKAKLRLPPAQLNPPLLLTGDDLVAQGLKPGRHFAVLLELVRDAQLESKIDSQEEALELVYQWFEDHKDNENP